jgi:hypothetical protein
VQPSDGPKTAAGQFAGNAMLTPGKRLA